jgi:flagellar hook assembly protein FlgD
VARPSHVVATLKGPGGAMIALANDSEPAGLHVLPWDGMVQGSPAAEGKWTLTLTGTDDRQVTTSAQRTFALDDTLSSLALKTDRHGRPKATFLLTRAAKVVVQIQRANGVRVVTLRSGQRAAGPEHASWRGRIDRHPAPAGRYQLVVQATSSVGTSSLAAPFSLSVH